MSRDLPAFLNIDVEPDGLQLPQHGPSTWAGYDALEPFLEDLRAAIGEVAPSPPRWAWFLRMDPQVEATSPSAAHAVTAFRDRIRRLEDRGDVFGIHVHPLRWNPGRGCWVHDFVDPAWVSECIVRSADAFGDAFGERPLRHRGVGAFLDGAAGRDARPPRGEGRVLGRAAHHQGEGARLARQRRVRHRRRPRGGRAPGDRAHPGRRVPPGARRSAPAERARWARPRAPAAHGEPAAGRQTPVVAGGVARASTAASVHRCG